MEKVSSLNAALLPPQRGSTEVVNFQLSLSWWIRCFKFLGMEAGSRARTAIFGLMSMWTLAGWLIKILNLQHIPGWLEVANSYSSEIPNGLALCSVNTLTYVFIVFHFRAPAGNLETRVNMFSGLEGNNVIFKTHQKWTLVAFLVNVIVLYATVFGIAGSSAANDSSASYMTLEPLWAVILDALITMVTFATNAAIIILVSGYFIMTCHLHVLQLKNYTSDILANPEEPVKISMDKFATIRAQVDSTSGGFSIWLTAYSCAMLVGWICWITSVVQNPSVGVSLWLRAGYNVLATAPLVVCLFAAASVSTAMQTLPCNVPPKAVMAESIYMIEHFTAQYSSRMLGFQVFGVVIEQDMLLKLCTLGGTVTVSYVQFLLNTGEGGL